MPGRGSGAGGCPATAGGHRFRRVLAAEGYRPEDDGEGGLVLLNCPFHRIAEGHADVVCAMNGAYLAGRAAAGCGVDPYRGAGPRHRRAPRPDAAQPAKCCAGSGPRTRRPTAAGRAGLRWRAPGPPAPSPGQQHPCDHQEAAHDLNQVSGVPSTTVMTAVNDHNQVEVVPGGTRRGGLQGDIPQQVGAQGREDDDVRQRPRLGRCLGKPHIRGDGEGRQRHPRHRHLRAVAVMAGTSSLRAMIV